MYKVIFKDLSDIITLVPCILSETFFGTRKGRPKMSSSSSPPDPSPDQDEEETVEYLTFGGPRKHFGRTLRGPWENFKRPSWPFMCLLEVRIIIEARFCQPIGWLKSSF